MRTISLAYQLILLTCKYSLNNEDIERLRVIVKEVDSLVDISLLAFKHGVYPFFYKTIIEHSSDLIDQEMREALDYLYYIIKVDNQQMTSELLKIVELFKMLKIDSISFKGPTLSKILYGDIESRQYQDLDILVKKKDLQKIKELLFEHGYKRSAKLNNRQEKHWIENKHDLGFFNKEKNVYLEAHWSLIDGSYPLKLDIEPFWKQQQTVEIDNNIIKTFSKDDLFFYICIHASKHLCNRLIWLKDIDTYIRKESLNWKYLIAKVENSDYKKMFYLSLSTTQHFMQTPLPKEIKQKIEETPNIKYLTNIIEYHLDKPQSVYRLHFNLLKLFPNFNTRLLYVYNIYAIPNIADYIYVNIPSRLYWLYHFVRPYRLITKYLKMAIK